MFTPVLFAYVPDVFVVRDTDMPYAMKNTEENAVIARLLYGYRRRSGDQGIRFLYDIVDPDIPKGIHIGGALAFSDTDERNKNEDDELFASVSRTGWRDSGLNDWLYDYQQSSPDTDYEYKGKKIHTVTQDELEHLGTLFLRVEDTGASPLY